MYLIVVGSLVVNIIFYLLLPCSTSFHEAILFWSLIHCQLSNSGSNPNFLLCNIPLCDISFKLLASSEAFCHLSLHIIVILFVNLQGWWWSFISGIRAGFSQCVDRTSTVRQFAPGLCGCGFELRRCLHEESKVEGPQHLGLLILRMLEPSKDSFKHFRRSFVEE